MVVLIIQMKCYVIPEIWLKSILMLFRYIQGTASSYSASVPNQPLQLRGNIYKRNTITIPFLQCDCFVLLPLERGWRLQSCETGKWSSFISPTKTNSIPSLTPGLGRSHMPQGNYRPSLTVSPGKRMTPAELWKRETVFLHKPNKDQFDPELDAWSGKISHATGELRPAWESESYQACVWESESCNSWGPSAIEPVLLSKRSHCNKQPVHHS